MKIYLVYDALHKDILIEEDVGIMLTFATVKRKLDMSKFYEFDPIIPSGFKEVFIDSGGYQLQTGVDTTMKINAEEYAIWLKSALKKYPEIVAYMNLDVSGNVDETLENLNYLEKEGLHPIPVWHWGDDDAILAYYCSEYSYVAIGGIAGKKKVSGRDLRPFFERVLSKYSNTRFHILGIGITASTVFRSFRPYSVDFSTWINCYKFGNVLCWDKDGLLREKIMPNEERDRIRVDKEFKKKIVKEAIQKIKLFSERIEQMHEPYQGQMELG